MSREVCHDHAKQNCIECGPETPKPDSVSISRKDAEKWLPQLTVGVVPFELFKLLAEAFEDTFDLEAVKLALSNKD